MSIENIVEQALKEGYLTPIMETEIGRICDSVAELSLEEYVALDRLMAALLTGDVVAMPRKHFINVMEELVLGEASGRVGELESTSNIVLDVGDIAAYALNRLPPLYATTEEGANYQRQRAKEELQELIAQQVEEALARFSTCPFVNPERSLIQKSKEDIFHQMNNLLKSYAPNYEPNYGGSINNF